MGKKELLVPMQMMYRAGKYDMPAESAQVSAVANHLYEVMEAFNVQSAYAGDPALMTDMLTIGREVYNQLRSAAISVDNCASAVIATANEFRDTDRNAKGDYQNLSASLRHHVVTPSVQYPVLPNLTQDGGAPLPDLPVGHGGIETPPLVAPTGDPTSPADDKDVRDAVATHDRNANPLPTLPVGGH